MSRPKSAHEAFFDIHPLTGASTEVFFADRSLESLDGGARVGTGAGGGAGTQPTARRSGRFLRASQPFGTLYWQRLWSALLLG
jgi:hypothetical protein